MKKLILLLAALLSACDHSATKPGTNDGQGHATSACLNVSTANLPEAHFANREAMIDGIAYEAAKALLETGCGNLKTVVRYANDAYKIECNAEGCDLRLTK